MRLRKFEAFPLTRAMFTILLALAGGEKYGLRIGDSPLIPQNLPYSATGRDLLAAQCQ